MLALQKGIDMNIYTYRYTLVRRHKRTDRKEEGISHNDKRSLENAMKTAEYEYPDWNYWIQDNQQTKLEDVFILDNLQ